MNIFRFCGDMLHLVSILMLLWKIHKNKSCVGVSCRMQEVYLIVFVCRYLDLLYEFISLYNSVMKIFFIISTGYLVYLMRFKPPVNQTYDRTVDYFKYEIYFIGPCLLLGAVTCEEFTLPEILWSSSIFLEAVAITPQLVLLAKMREVLRFCLFGYVFGGVDEGVRLRVRFVIDVNAAGRMYGAGARAGTRRTRTIGLFPIRRRLGIVGDLLVPPR